MQTKPCEFRRGTLRSGPTGNILFTALPATFVSLGLIAGLSVDTYRAWGLTGVVVDCKPQFAVDLYYTNPQFHSSTPADARSQAMIVWIQGVNKTYGIAYANFWHAKESFTGVMECHPNLDGDPNYCGFASGQPCRR